MAGLQRKHRITVDEYHRMGLAGVFAPGTRVELVEGEIIDMVPIGTSHNAVVNRLNRLLHQALGDVALVQIQGVISLGPFSEPQPDVAVLRPRDDCYGPREATSRRLAAGQFPGIAIPLSGLFTNLAR